jgi:hypothetical protein
MGYRKVAEVNAQRHLRAFLLASLSICALLISTSCEQSGEYAIATLDLGKGRSIEILASNRVEVSQGFYYQVKVDGKVVVPMFMLCTGLDNGKLKFKTIAAKGGDLVAIFEQKYPDEILAIHDFKTNVSWPRGFDRNTAMENNKIGEAFFKELQAEHPDIQLHLGQKHGCI